MKGKRKMKANIPKLPMGAVKIFPDMSDADVRAWNRTEPYRAREYEAMANAMLISMLYYLMPSQARRDQAAPCLGGHDPTSGGGPEGSPCADGHIPAGRHRQERGGLLHAGGASKKGMRRPGVGAGRDDGC